jgi:hypothetical protein
MRRTGKADDMSRRQARIDFMEPPLITAPGFVTQEMASDSYCWSFWRGQLWLTDLGMTIFRKVPIEARPLGDLSQCAHTGRLYLSDGDILSIEISEGHLQRTSPEVVAEAADVARRLGNSDVVVGPSARFSTFLGCVAHTGGLVSNLLGDDGSAVVWFEPGGSVTASLMLPRPDPVLAYGAKDDVILCTSLGSGDAAIVEPSAVIRATIMLGDQANVRRKLRQAAFSPSGGKVALGTERGLGIWDFTKNTLAWVDDEGSCSASWSPDGKMIYYVFKGRELRVVRADEESPPRGVMIASLPGEEGDSLPLVADPPIVEPAGRYILADLFNKEKHLFDGREKVLCRHNYVILDLERHALMRIIMHGYHAAWVGHLGIAIP